MWPALCCAILLAQTVPTPPTPTRNEAFLAQTEAAIEKDEAFLALHRGYLAYLRDHPGLLNAERAWWDTAIEPTVADAEARFDEALLSDAEASAALDTAYDLLARDPALREKTEALQRIEFTQPDAKALMATGLRALRADPDLALRLLGGANNDTTLHGALQEFLSYLRTHPALTQELGGLFGALSDAPLAQTRLLPWWQQLTQNTPAATAYAGLAQEFLSAPRRFWAWHARQLAWANDAQARAWTRYLYRRARRIPGLGLAYTHYLHAAFQQDIRLDDTERHFAKAHGPAPPFPPKPAPPTLSPLVKLEDEPGKQKPNYFVPTTPTRPERPSLPTLPKLEMRKSTPRPSGIK